MENESLASINFIIGMGRSGTTLLTSILNSHSKIYANPENNFLLFLSNYLNSKKEFNETDIAYINKMLALDTNTTLTVWKGEVSTKKKILTKEEVIHEIYMSSSIQSKAKKVVAIYDKNPEYTLQLKVLKKLYPKANYLAISRHYLDNIASRKKFESVRKKRLINSDWTSIYILAISWNYYNKKIIRMLDSEKMFHVKYEDLTRATELTLNRLFNFIGLEYEENVLNYHQEINLAKNINRSQLTEKQKSSVKEMHKNLEKPISANRIGVWEQQLSEKQRAVCDVICGNTASRLGYQKLKDYGTGFKTRILVTSMVFKFLYRIYLGLKNLKYYKLPLSIRARIFRK